MVKVGTISVNLEDYVETIFDLIRELGVARISDVAKRKSVKKASVHEAIKRLANEGLVSHERYSQINLTKKGANLAKTLELRHAVIKRFLSKVIMVSPDIADKDACAIEHYIHPETVKGLVQFVKYLDSCPQGEPDWLSRFYQCGQMRKKNKTNYLCRKKTERSKK